MLTIKRFCYLSLVGTAMVLAVPAQSETMARGHEAKAPMTNRLATNRLAGNRLGANRLASNRLGANRLATNTIVPGDGAFTGVAAIDLPNGTRLTR